MYFGAVNNTSLAAATMKNAQTEFSCIKKKVQSGCGGMGGPTTEAKNLLLSTSEGVTALIQPSISDGGGWLLY